MFLSACALIIVASCTLLLITGRASPFVSFSLIPVVVALAAGFSLTDVEGFFHAGLTKVTPIATMFIFAILFFALMQERGLFDPLIRWVVNRAGDRLIAVTSATVAVSICAHLDGSGASTFLICVPTLLPVYQRLHMSPYLLLLLVSASASVMNMLPWGGPLGRAASVIGADPASIWRGLIPVQGAAVALLFVGAYILGKREQGRAQERAVRVGRDGSAEPTQAEGAPVEQVSDAELTLPQGWWLNLLLTLSVIATLLSGVLPSALVFILALSAALLLNRQRVEEQRDFMKRHAWSALQMAMIIFAAGVFLGVLTESKMLRALTRDLMAYLPELLQAQVHVIIGFLGAPLELVLNTDAYYFALLPIVEQAVQPHGVSSESVVYAMLVGNIIGTFISPFSPALWLALGLAKLEMGAHIRYSFMWVWGLSVALMTGAWLLGLF